MKIHILFDFIQGPSGGGNNFLKSLRQSFVDRGFYVDNIKDLKRGDVILVNSYHNLDKAILLKAFGGVKVVHRLDGLFYMHRGRKWMTLDKVVGRIAEKIFDGVIFQSKWSLNEYSKLGFNGNNISIILNSINEKIFFPKLSLTTATGKIKVIITSWSSNKNKGSLFFKYLDDNLDFNRFEVLFIGNSSDNFKNIKIINPLTQELLAKELRSSDIYISPAKNEACSNAILEALGCGLPVLALNSGSNAEIIGSAGELFDSESEMLIKLDRMSNNLDFYRSKIIYNNFDVTADKYFDFCSNPSNKRRKVLLSFYFYIYLFLIKNFLRFF